MKSMVRWMCPVVVAALALGTVQSAAPGFAASPCGLPTKSPYWASYPVGGIPPPVGYPQVQTWLQSVAVGPGPNRMFATDVRSGAVVRTTDEGCTWKVVYPSGAFSIVIPASSSA